MHAQLHPHARAALHRQRIAHAADRAAAVVRLYLQVQRIDQVAGDRERAAAAQPVQHVIGNRSRPHVGLAVLARIEVAAAVALVHVRIGTGGDPEAASLGKQLVPYAPHRGGHLVEATEGGRGAVAVQARSSRVAW